MKRTLATLVAGASLFGCSVELPPEEQRVAEEHTSVSQDSSVEFSHSFYGEKHKANDSLELLAHSFTGTYIEEPISSHQVWQFDTNPTADERTQWRAQGVEIQNPLGQNAYVVHITDPSFSREIASNSVRKAFNLQAEDKITQGAHITLQSERDLPWRVTREGITYTSVDVTFFDDVSDTNATTAIESAGGLVHSILRVDGKMIPSMNTYRVVFENGEEGEGIDALAHSHYTRAIDRGGIRLSELNSIGKQVNGIRPLQKRSPHLTGAWNNVPPQESPDKIIAQPNSWEHITIGVYDVGVIYEGTTDLEGRMQKLYDTEFYAHDHATHVACTVAGNGASSYDIFTDTCTDTSPWVMCDDATMFNEETQEWEIDYARGLSAMKGMAYRAKVITSYHGSCDPYCLFDTINNMPQKYADMVAEGVEIITNSIGSNVAFNGYPCEINGTPTDITSRYLDGFIRDGNTTTWAAGNERASSFCQNEETYGKSGYDTLGAPVAGCKSCITVGSADVNDESTEIPWEQLTNDNLMVSFFSSFGPTDDGRTGVDITTFGGGENRSVTSCIGYNEITGDPSYGDKMGTSMATPSIAGGLGVVFQLTYELDQPEVRNVPALNRAILMSSADWGSDPTMQVPNVHSGYGYADFNQFARILENHNYNLNAIHEGETHVYYYEVERGETRVSIAWDDIPSVENTTHALINDLDLIVIGPDGKEHEALHPDPEKPWCDTTGWVQAYNSEPTKLPYAACALVGDDHTNSEEMVLIPAGMYDTGSMLEIHVTGHSISIDNHGHDFQKYGLAVSKARELTIDPFFR